jgi:hypothetical protein
MSLDEEKTVLESIKKNKELKEEYEEKLKDIIVKVADIYK